MTKRFTVSMPDDIADEVRELADADNKDISSVLAGLAHAEHLRRSYTTAAAEQQTAGLLDAQTAVTALRRRTSRRPGHAS